IEPLVPEKAFVAGDEQGQVVDGVHYRRRNFFQLSAFLLRGAHIQTPVDYRTNITIVRRLSMSPSSASPAARPQGPLALSLHKAIATATPPPARSAQGQTRADQTRRSAPPG